MQQSLEEILRSRMAQPVSIKGKEVHLNPWKNIQMMKAKAAEMEIDLQERYDYGTDVCREEDHRKSVGDSGEE
jgi:hypothetical protein